MKKYLVWLLKMGLAVGIIAFLLWQAGRQDPEQFRRLWDRQKDWSALTAGFGIAMFALCLTFVRWYVLVRALDIPFRLRDAFRLGFLGYLLNFVGAGAVGGDLFKAVFIAREQPQRRTEAVATVALDRICGLYFLLVVATLAILLGDMSHAGKVVAGACQVTLLATAAGTVVVGLLLLLPLREGPLLQWLRHLPKVGPVLGRLIEAFRIYRRKPGTLVLVAAMSLAVHMLIPLAVYLLARALVAHPPTLAAHYVVVPFSCCAAALPTPGGLGTFELAMDQLYKWVSNGACTEGLIVALAYRLITIVIACIGGVYYLACRREVKAIMAAAQAEQAPSLAPGEPKGVADSGEREAPAELIAGAFHGSAGASPSPQLAPRMTQGHRDGTEGHRDGTEAERAVAAGDGAVQIAEAHGPDGRPKKVLLVANTGWYFYNFRRGLLRALSAAGCRVAIVCPHDEYVDRLVEDGIRWIDWRLDRAGMNPLGDLRSLRALRRIYRAEAPDLVHHFTVKPILYGTLAAKQAGVPRMVNSVTGLGHVFTSQRLLAYLIRPWIRRWYLWALTTPGSRPMFQNADDLAELCRRSNRLAERAVLTGGSGVDLQRFSAGPQGGSKANGTSCVMFVGRLIEEKGIREFVEAARLAKQRGLAARFVACGCPDPGNRSSVDPACIEKWRAEGHVEFPGHTDRADQAIREADVIVLPSYREGTPRVLLEAAAMGKPAIASDVPGCREVVTHGYNGLLVPPREPRAIADALQQLLGDPALRARMGRAGRTRAEERFDERRVVDRTLRVYRELHRNGEPAASDGGDTPLPRGVFVFSLDLELAWGTRGRPAARQAGPFLDGTRAAIRGLLDLFDRYHVPATWAMVGALLLRNHHGPSPPPVARRPAICRCAGRGRGRGESLVRRGHPGVAARTSGPAGDRMPHVDPPIYRRAARQGGNRSARNCGGSESCLTSSPWSSQPRSSIPRRGWPISTCCARRVSAASADRKTNGSSRCRAPWFPPPCGCWTPAWRCARVGLPGTCRADCGWCLRRSSTRR